MLIDGDAPRGGRFVSKAHFRSLAGAIVGTLGLVATVVVVAFQSGPGAPRLAVKDVKTNDRCVVYTYFQDQGMGDDGTVEAWKEIWSGAGWTPVVLNEDHARLHPDYEDFKATVAKYPTTNPAGYETACYLRHLAMAAVGGGYLTDYDTINVNVPPSPNCDFMPFDGQLTTHDDYVPAMVSGSAEEYDRVARAMKEVDINVVMPEIGQKMVSDMYLLQYFIAHGTVHARHTFYSAPNWMPTPPCNDEGVEVPMMFHLSHEMMAKTIGGDRETALRQWTQTLRRAKRNCKPREVHSTEEYAAHYFPQNEDDLAFVKALRMEFECSHKKRYRGVQCESKEAIREKLSKGVDKHGKKIKM